MSEFYVKPAKLNNAANNIRKYSDRMRSLQDDVRDIHRGIRYNIRGSQDVDIRLRQLEQVILDEAVKLDSLDEAVTYIAENYRAAERRITGQTIDSGASGIVSGIADGINEFGEWLSQLFGPFIKSLRDLMVSWGIIKAEKQERVPAQAVTKAQEREMDLYMQQQIKKVLKKDRYSKRTWVNASPDERKKIIEEYVSEVAVIMGLSVGGAEFFDEPKENGYITNGYYDPVDGSVHINEWRIREEEGKDSYDLMSTVVHELRHAYQHDVVDNPEKYVVTEETVNSWKDSFDNYKSTEGFEDEGMSEREAYQAYRNQAVEKDARSFAKQG